MLAQGTSTVTLRQPHWTASRHLRVALVRLIAMVRADNRDDRRCAKDAAPRGPVLLGFMMVRANPYTVTLTQFGTTARKGDRWQEGDFSWDSLIEGTQMRDGSMSGIWVVLVVQQSTFARGGGGSTLSSPRGI